MCITWSYIRLVKTITVLATGTRGDVQPFIALAYGLQQAGHHVHVVTNAIYESWVRSYGLDVRTVSWDPHAAMLLQNQLAGQKNPFVYVRKQLENTHQVYSSVQRESFEACQAADCLVFSVLSAWGYSIAEKINVPMIAGMLHPLERTSAFPMQLIPINLGGTLNWASHILAEYLMELVIGGEVNAFRTAIGLPPHRFPFTLFKALRENNIPLLCNLSPAIIPRPGDWAERIRMDGYWFLPAAKDWSPPPALTDFLADGDAPVYIGFGSTITGRAKETGQIITKALHQVNCRGVLAKGWGELKGLEFDPGRFIVIDEVPHDWLFERMAMIVHHGGAGTTASAFCAGVPQIVVPHMQDQPFWGNKTYQLGVGAKPVPRSRLSVDSFARALQSVIDDPSMRTRAEEIGEKVRAEQGVEKAVAVIERTFNLQKLHPDS